MHTICAAEKQNMQDDICLIRRKIQKPLIERRGNSLLERRDLAFQNRKKSHNMNFYRTAQYQPRHLKVMPLPFWVEGKPRSWHANSMLNHLYPENDATSGPLVP